MRKTVLFTILLSALACSHAYAGGLNVIGGLGSKAGAMSGAYNAISDDASLFYYNLTGLLNFDEPYAEAGVSALKPTFTKEYLGLRYKSRSDVIHILPLMGYVCPINEDMAFGIGVTVPYGLGASFAGGLGMSESETLITEINITPAIAFQLTDRLAIGFGPNVGIAQFKYQAPYDIKGRPLPIMTDSEGLGIGLGASVGIRYHLSDRLVWGFSFMSESKIPLRGKTKIGAGLLSFTDDFKSSFAFPAKIGTGIAYQATDKLLVAFDTNYWFYSNAVKEMTLHLERLHFDKTNELGWRDNYSCHLGMRYLLDDNWTASCGIGFQTAPVPNSTMSQLTPDIKGWDLAYGVSYHKNGFGLNANIIYAWGDRNVKPSLANQAPGRYSAETLTFSLSGSWSF